MYSNSSDNSKYVWLILFLLLLSSAVSAAFTGMFAFNLAQSMGGNFVVVLFVMMGLLLDLTKSLAPGLAYAAFRTSPLLSVVITFLFLFLLGISFTASLSALEKSVSTQQSQTQEYIFITEQIDALKQESEGFKKVADSKVEINHLSDANVIFNKVSANNKKIEALQNQLLELESDTFISKYGTEFSIIMSAMLELLTGVLAIALFHFKGLANLERVNSLSSSLPERECYIDNMNEVSNVGFTDVERAIAYLLIRQPRLTIDDISSELNISAYKVMSVADKLGENKRLTAPISQ
jgi:hypothetical protein